MNIVIKTKKGNFTVLHFLVLKKSIEDKDKLKKVVNDLLDNEEFKVCGQLTLLCLTIVGLINIESCFLLHFYLKNLYCGPLAIILFSSEKFLLEFRFWRSD